jgi:hypothetical protein
MRERLRTWLVEAPSAEYWHHLRSSSAHKGTGATAEGASIENRDNQAGFASQERVNRLVGNNVDANGSGEN